MADYPRRARSGAHNLIGCEDVERRCRHRACRQRGRDARTASLARPMAWQALRPVSCALTVSPVCHLPFRTTWPLVMLAAYAASQKRSNRPCAKSGAMRHALQVRSVQFRLDPESRRSATRRLWRDKAIARPHHPASTPTRHNPKYRHQLGRSSHRGPRGRLARNPECVVSLRCRCPLSVC